MGFSVIRISATTSGEELVLISVDSSEIFRGTSVGSTVEFEGIEGIFVVEDMEAGTIRTQERNRKAIIITNMVNNDVPQIPPIQKDEIKK